MRWSATPPTVVKENGGKVLGQVRVPLNTSDFSSYLLQAQASGAKIIGLANAGGDTINTIKQAAEFGIVRGGQKLAGLLIFLTDMHSLGLKTAQRAAADLGLLLGPGRRGARLLEALFGQDGPSADDGAGRRLQRRRSMARSRQGGQHARRAGRDEAAEIARRSTTS